MMKIHLQVNNCCEFAFMPILHMRIPNKDFDHEANLTNDSVITPIIDVSLDKDSPILANYDTGWQYGYYSTKDYTPMKKYNYKTTPYDLTLLSTKPVGHSITKYSSYSYNLHTVYSSVRCKFFKWIFNTLNEKHIYSQCNYIFCCKNTRNFSKFILYFFFFL